MYRSYHTWNSAGHIVSAQYMLAGGINSGQLSQAGPERVLFALFQSPFPPVSTQRDGGCPRILPHPGCLCQSSSVTLCQCLSPSWTPAVFCSTLALPPPLNTTARLCCSQP